MHTVTVATDLRHQDERTIATFADYISALRYVNNMEHVNWRAIRIRDAQGRQVLGQLG